MLRRNAEANPRLSVKALVPADGPYNARDERHLMTLDARLRSAVHGVLRRGQAARGVTPNSPGTKRGCRGMRGRCWKRCAARDVCWFRCCSADSTSTASTRPRRCWLRAKRDCDREADDAAVPAGPGGAERSFPLWRGVRRRRLVPAARRSGVGEVGARAHPRASRAAGRAAAGPDDSRCGAASACRAAGRGSRSQAAGR